MKQLLIRLLNKHYSLYLAKPKHRRRLNNFLYFFVWKVAFFFSSLRKTDEKLLLFVANHDSEMPKDFASLFNLAKENGYKCICLYKFKGGSPIIYKNELSKIKADIKFQKYFARAKFTFLYDYYLPAYANKTRKGTRLVQLWHACGAFKKWGYSTKDSPWGLESELFEKYRVHKNYTDIVTSSEYIIPKYAEAFDADESIIRPLGVARTDVYFDPLFVLAQKKILLNKFPQVAGKATILWAPTYRGNSLAETKDEKPIDFVMLKELIGDKYVFLVKLHPHIANKFSLSEAEREKLDGFVVDISNDVTIDTALCSADIVITDYSSLIFEYALLKRPMIFYAYDLEDYVDKRNFYYDYKTLIPGKIAKTTEELAALIASVEAYDYSLLEDFTNKFMSGCDGNSTKRIFEELVQKPI